MKDSTVICSGVQTWMTASNPVKACFSAASSLRSALMIWTPAGTCFSELGRWIAVTRRPGDINALAMRFPRSPLAYGVSVYKYRTTGSRPTPIMATSLILITMQT